MIKVNIIGKVHSISGINTVGKSNYVNQVIVLHQPEENFRGKIIKEEFFVITVFSNSTTDHRFVQPDKVKDAIGAEANAECYLKGERWVDNNGGENFTHKLNLINWIKS